MDFKMEDKKILAGFELILVILSTFAFSYIMDQEMNPVKDIESELSIANEGRVSLFEAILDGFLMNLKKPMIPFASAEEIQGCCALTTTGQKCATTTASSCSSINGGFALGQLCKDSSFCRSGCCYNDAKGIFDKNVLSSDCQNTGFSFDASDPNCNNKPGAVKGCCVLGDQTFFETEGKCYSDTVELARGINPSVDWRRNTNELQCLLLSSNKKEGACVLQGGLCTYGTQEKCLTQKGEFSEGILCTNPILNTSCQKTTQTKCIDGKDGVYLVDSCGNAANVYDASRINDQTYWDSKVNTSLSCGASSNLGNANSTTCGNCNRFTGGICAKASEDNFNVQFGDNYCRDTSCKFEGNTYKNGESWCVYDGQVGNGSDTVGSRHWKYFCDYGKVKTEPCADLRNQICVWSKETKSPSGVMVNFNNANCVTNNWGNCLSLNSDEDSLSKCASTVNCRLEKVDIADHFKFDICLPKYPAGFNVKQDSGRETANSLCGWASMNCTVVREPKASGGCKYVANKDCLSAEFGEKMNNLCMGLGDCGASVNYVGQYTQNVKIVNSPTLNNAYIQMLKGLATPSLNNYAPVENYTEYLQAVGLIGSQNQNLPDGSGPTNPTDMGLMAGLGIAGIAYAGYSLHVGLFTTTTAAGATTMAPFAGALIGAGIGIALGSWIAGEMGLSPTGSLLMMIAGGLFGGGVYLLLFAGVPGLGWALIIGALVMGIISSFLGGDDCKPINVQFTCKAWKPPVGGSDCEKCNGDLNKPCSEYRCNSLGAACEFINKGTSNELCVDDDPTNPNPPTFLPGNNNDGSGNTDTYSDSGISISGPNGQCLEPYTDLVASVITDKPAYCKFDTELKSFEELGFDAGFNGYIKNHTIRFPLLDPSHGESQGINISAQVKLYVKCQGTHGQETPGYYVISSCIKEGPDKRAPIINKMIPASGQYTGFNSTSWNVTLYTNEVSTCKWDLGDKSYSDMSYNFTCESNIATRTSPFGYSCISNLAVSSVNNNYYIRCADQPWLIGTNRSNDRNSNIQSTVYNLKRPSNKISIDSISPSGEFEVGTPISSINLEVETSGGASWHKCSYSFSGYDNMIELFETGTSHTHKQPLTILAGQQTVYVSCRDETGDYARSQTSFNIIHDQTTPVVTRVWRESSTLYLTTNENSECRYSNENCGFVFSNATSMGNGKTHSSGVSRGQTYFIKCKDDFGNVPNECSISVNIP